MNLTDHFTLEELVHSNEGVRRNIDNTPPDELLPNLKRVAETMEQVRTLLGGKPIIVSSGYRGPRLNVVIGGATKSAHMQGLACDFICPAFGTPLEIATLLADALTDFDQLIWEGTWVHLGLAEGVQRREVLTAKFPKGRAVYTRGLNP